jgi:hypothetical protein
MGDERRLDRFNDANKAKKIVVEKKKKNKTNKSCKTNNAAAETFPDPATEAVASAPISEEGPLSQELARLYYQRNFQNILAYNTILGRYNSNVSPRSLLSSNYGGLGLGGDTFQGLRPQDIVNTSLVSIERDIQECLDCIAAQYDRLSMLRSIREIKMSMGPSWSDLGLGSLLAQRSHP